MIILGYTNIRFDDISHHSIYYIGIKPSRILQKLKKSSKSDLQLHSIGRGGAIRPWRGM